MVELSKLISLKKNQEINFHLGKNLIPPVWVFFIFPFLAKIFDYTQVQYFLNISAPMLRLKKITLYSCIIVLLSFSPSLHAIFDEKNITQNNSSLFSPKLSRSLRELETRWVIDIDLISQKNIQLKKEKNTYKIWAAPGIKNGTWILQIHYKENSFPLNISLKLPKKSETDFSLFWDMYRFSLQEQSLSCESNATSLILSTLLWKEIPEAEVIQTLPKSTYYGILPEKNGKSYLWWNPQEGFVGYIGHTGSIIAKQKLMTGYGVYEKPIAKIFQQYGFKTQILTQGIHSSAFTKYEHLTTLLEHIQEGNMVQLWADWCTKESYDDGILSSKNELTQDTAKLGISAKNTCYNVDEARELRWSYMDENGRKKEHIWLDGQHAFVLLGWKWDIKKPTHIRVWDTDTGYHSYETVEWMRKWEKMDYKSLVIFAQ